LLGITYFHYSFPFPFPFISALTTSYIFLQIPPYLKSGCSFVAIWTGAAGFSSEFTGADEDPFLNCVDLASDWDISGALAEEAGFAVGVWWRDLFCGRRGLFFMWC
jgi:hypothetical protein